MEEEFWGLEAKTKANVKPELKMKVVCTTCERDVME